MAACFLLVSVEVLLDTIDQNQGVVACHLNSHHLVAQVLPLSVHNQVRIHTAVVVVEACSVESDRRRVEAVRAVVAVGVVVDHRCHLETDLLSASNARRSPTVCLELISSGTSWLLIYLWLPKTSSGHALCRVSNIVTRRVIMVRVDGKFHVAIPLELLTAQTRTTQASCLSSNSSRGYVLGSINSFAEAMALENHSYF